MHYISRAASYDRLKLPDLIVEGKESISFRFNRSRDIICNIHSMYVLC